jgi:hypothetical protein
VKLEPHFAVTFNLSSDERRPPRFFCITLYAALTQSVHPNDVSSDVIELENRLTKMCSRFSSESVPTSRSSVNRRSVTHRLFTVVLQESTPSKPSSSRHVTGMEYALLQADNLAHGRIELLNIAHDAKGVRRREAVRREVGCTAGGDVADNVRECLIRARLLRTGARQPRGE